MTHILRQTTKLIFLICGISAILFVGCKSTNSISGGKPSGKNVLSPEAKTKITTLFIEASTKEAQGYAAEALNDYLQVINFAPNHAPSHYNAGKIYLSQNENVKAQEQALIALKLDDTNQWYHQLVADVYLKSNQIDLGISTLEKAIKKFPAETDFQTQLVDAFMKAQKYDAALNLLDKLESKSGMFITAVLQKKEIYRFQKNYPKAEFELNRLIKATRDNSSFYYELHDCYLMQKRNEDAMRTLEQLLENHPNDGVANFKLIEYYNAIGNTEKANELVNKNFDNPQLTVESKVNYLVRMLQSPNYQSNMGLINRLATKISNQNPTSAMAASLRGDIYATFQKPDSARIFFKKSAKLDETNPRVWEAILRLDLQMAKDDSLLLDSEKALEIFPNNPTLNYYNGVANYQKKNYKAASKTIEKFSRFESKDPAMLTQAYIILGDCYHKLGEFDKSDKAFTKGLEYDPNNLTILNNFAYYLSLRNSRLNDALAMSEKTIKMMPNSSSYLDTYGWINFQLGKLNEAKEYIEKSYGINPSGDVAEHLGDVYYKLGNIDKAISLWQEAKQKGVNNDALNQKINTRKLQ